MKIVVGSSTIRGFIYDNDNVIMVKHRVFSRLVGIYIGWYIAYGSVS